MTLVSTAITKSTKQGPEYSALKLDNDIPLWKMGRKKKGRTATARDRCSLRIGSSTNPNYHDAEVATTGAGHFIPTLSRTSLCYQNGSSSNAVRTVVAAGRRHAFQSFGLPTKTIFGLPPPGHHGVVLMTRGGQVKTKKPPSHSSTRKSSTLETSEKKKKKKSSKHKSPLSDSQPFIPIDRIAQLTLGDLGTVFDFAVKSTKEGFDKQQFLAGISPKVKQAVDAVEKAAATSRGANTRILRIDSDEQVATTPGNFDTFNFCAAMRILAEWRLVRQVPEGYSRFASSMKMGHKDVVKNIMKIEGAAHDYIDNQEEKYGKSEIYSPTLRQLLQFEKENDLHPNLPRLKEVSAAMGLLWVRRQLHFQMAFFENTLDKSFTTASDAFQAAYARVYSNFHGMAVRKIFNYSLQAAPEMQEVYKCMQPPPEGGQPKAVDQGMSGDAEKDALAQMGSFLQVSQPLLTELERLFAEMNMDDPKKV